MNHPKLKRTLLQAFKSAGTLVRQSITRQKTITKKGEIDLVTEIDCAAEKRIIKIISKTFPDHSFLCEESGATRHGGQARRGGQAGNSKHRWIIDPIDGTTNFAHSLPICSVSIAYEENGVVKMGGVYDPIREELFYAEKGRGAFLNGKKIKVSKTKKLNDALLATGFPYDRRKDPDKYLRIFREFLMQAQEIRRLGSAALDLCYVACGRFDGYWEAKLNPWDKAAGMLILKEAGGKLSDYAGNPLTLTEPTIVASNGLMHASIVNIIKTAPSL